MALSPGPVPPPPPGGMEIRGNSLPRMNWDSAALAEEWSRFKQQAEQLFRGPFSASKEDEKCCYLLIWVGDRGRDIFKSWADMSPDEQSRLDAYYARFDEWVAGRVNPIFARARFYERRQGPGEPLDQFVADLVQLAANCCFPDAEEMVRDRLVCGVYLNEVKQKLIQEGLQLSLKRALDIARICEMTHGRMEDVYRSSPFGDYKPPWLKRKAQERAALELSTPAESCDDSGSSHETEEAQDWAVYEIRKYVFKNRIRKMNSPLIVTEMNVFTGNYIY